MSKGREQASESRENSVESANSLPINEIAPYWLAALIDSADDAIISKTLDGIITSWNKGAERIFGYTAEEAIGKPVLMLIPPDHENEEPSILARIRADERVEHYETIRVRKDGRLINISLTVSPIKTPDGTIIGASKIARDITDIKRAEASLRDSENQLRQITDAIPALISYVDKEHHYRFVNRNYKEWFGYSTEDLVGRHLRDIIGEAAYKLVLPRIERVLAGEQFEFEQLMPYADGKERYIHVNYIPGIDEASGEVKGFYALVQDITESKKAEARLRESEARFAKAFSSSPLVLTISSLKTGKLLEVNDTFVQTTGFSREEAIGRTTVELGLWAKTQEREEEMEIVRRKGQIRNAEYVFRVKDGREIIGLLSAEHIEIGGESFALTVIQDITKRKRAEEKLRQSDARLRLALDISRTSAFEIDLKTDEVQTDDIGREIYGWQKDEPLTFSKVQSRFHADDREAVMHAVAAAFAPEGSDEFEVEQRIIRTNGETRWIRVRGRAFFEGEGEAKRPVRCLGTYIDITESKLAEEKLRASEERYRMLFTSIDQGFCLCEVLFDEANQPVDYRFLEVNPAFEKMTGISNAEAITGQTARALVPNLEDKWVEIYGQIALTGEPVRFVDDSQAMSGRWFDVYAFRVGGDESRKVAIFFNNVTERKKSELRLRESEERMRLATEAADIYSWEVDLEHQKAIYAANTVKVLGFMMPDDLAESIALIHEDDRAATMEKFQRAIANQTKYEAEFRIVNPQTGEIIWQSIQGIFIGHAGDKAKRFVGITQNVTERKRAEQEREQLLRRERAARREAEEASRLKDEFLATVSHELRTPLNAILGWSQMLRSGNFSRNESARAVETIYRNAKSQAQLIEDILDVSRIITGKLRLEPRQILLAPVIQSAVETLRPAIEAKNIRLQMRLNFEPQTVCADPDRLQQVVWNLLSNAIKFTPEKGEVTIELNGDERETRIIVSDTGKGISPEFLPCVFERFRQADGSSTRKHGGLGLGLAIVRHIVELHGGSIEAGSGGENAGTTFTVRLPVNDLPVKPSKKTAEEAAATGAAFAGDALSTAENSKIKGLRVLLVDDEADTLELLGVVLSQNGAEVKAETSARGALEIIKNWQPDVIVSDIAMPEEDGYSFIKKLRALPPESGGAIPVVALTAYVGIKERTRVLSNGFQMYVPKPVEPSELLEALVNFTDN